MGDMERWSHRKLDDGAQHRAAADIGTTTMTPDTLKILKRFSYRPTSRMVGAVLLTEPWIKHL